MSALRRFFDRLGEGIGMALLLGSLLIATHPLWTRESPRRMEYGRPRFRAEKPRVHAAHFRGRAPAPTSAEAPSLKHGLTR